jgi:glycosyltransferase involved in cell wall biosynthesis
MFQTEQAAFINGIPVDVTIVMPCLNEAQSLPHCIRNAQDALDRIVHRYGLSGEIVIADNGSVDGSQAIATALGARVVPVPERGYGAALIGGCQAALGRYILMGDCDGSYDFTDGVAMIGKLIEGHALCMGSRFDGGIAPGAMPWKNRYIGNPVLTGLLNLFFRAGINDAHCGLRAIRKESFHRLHLSGKGMEFASEMVIKTALLKLPITQVPATLSTDLRDRAPHLRPWRDGWRHFRYLVMLSPTWAFGVPALAAMGTGALIMMISFLHTLNLFGSEKIFGESWTIIAGFLFTTGHLAAIMAVACHFFGISQGYCSLRPGLSRISRHLSLESALVGGTSAIALSLGGFVAIGAYWRASGFIALPTILPIVAAAVLGATGMQTIIGGLLLSIIMGHRADFGREINKRALRNPWQGMQHS